MKSKIKPSGECFVLTGRGYNQEESHFRGAFASEKEAEDFWKKNANNNGHPLQFCKLSHSPATIEKTLWAAGHQNIREEIVPRGFSRFWDKTGFLLSERRGRNYRTAPDGTITCQLPDNDRLWPLPKIRWSPKNTFGLHRMGCDLRSENIKWRVFAPLG